MAYAFDPSPVVTIPVVGSSLLYPVHRIYCVGRNYAEHAREMGSDPDKEPPFFFAKSADQVVLDGKFPYPPATKDVHYEMELCVMLKSGGTDIRPQDCQLGCLALRRRSRSGLECPLHTSSLPLDVDRLA